MANVSKKLTPFTRAVCTEVRRIPIGTTRTYRQVAECAGYPLAWRAVGNVLNKNYDPAIPCHRVVRSDGAVGGYNRGEAAKKKLLAEEQKS